MAGGMRLFIWGNQDSLTFQRERFYCDWARRRTVGNLPLLLEALGFQILLSRISCRPFLPSPLLPLPPRRGVFK